MNGIDTPIQSFPADLRVGGRILPPAGLLDIEAFMATQPDPMVIFRAGSFHQRLHQRAQLCAFPDLRRVVDALQPLDHLHLWRKYGARCGVQFHRGRP